MNRQRILERAGWRFWRCFASTFVMHRQAVVDDLLATLSRNGIEPVSGGVDVRSIHAQSITYTAFSHHAIDAKDSLELVEA